MFERQKSTGYCFVAPTVILPKGAGKMTPAAHCSHPSIQTGQFPDCGAASGALFLDPVAELAFARPRTMIAISRCVRGLVMRIRSALMRNGPLLHAGDRSAPDVNCVSKEQTVRY